MPLPLIPVVAALSSGGSLVAHSAGGLIVYSSAAAGYVGGTYISTGALASFLTGTAVTAGAVGTSALMGSAIWAYGTVSGAALSFVGGAGLFGTTLGATGVTGVLMKWGIVSSTPLILPIIISLAALFLILFAFYYSARVRKLRSKVLNAREGEEVVFNKSEAKIIQKMLLSASRKHNWLWIKMMEVLGRLSSKRQAN
jgi:hypothetical protein